MADKRDQAAYQQGVRDRRAGKPKLSAADFRKTHPGADADDYPLYEAGYAGAKDGDGFKPQKAAQVYKMSDGKFPISDQHSANSAWKLRSHSDTHSEASVVAHIRRACKALGLKFPGEDKRQKALFTGLHLTIDQLSRQVAREFTIEARKKAVKEGASLPDGSFPIYNQADLNHAAELLHDAQDPVAARRHIVKRANQLKLRLPYGWPEEREQRHKQDVADAQHHRRLQNIREGASAPFVGAAREAAARYRSRNALGIGGTRRPHGFVYPTGLPACTTCGEPASAAVHINPMTPAQMQATSLRGGIEVASSLGGDKRPHKRLMRAHPYSQHPRVVASLTCQACGEPMGSHLHKSGLPTGVGIDYLLGSNDGPPGGGLSSSALGGMAATRASEAPERAFVTESAGKVILAAPATAISDPEQLPRELALAWQKAAKSNDSYLWLAGRFVEADRPNRNKAMWSTKDLELGEPTVANGPLNWLHEERHIIGSIADAKLVKVDRQAAGAVGNHIAAAAVVWPWLWPNEARMIAAASQEGRLWYSMECISREVACLECDNTMTYRDYMTKASERCGHMRMGSARRFAQPTFLGGAVILPPVRPGWANANAEVMQRAAAEVERQAAAFVGMEATDAEMLAAQIITSTTEEA